MKRIYLDYASTTPIDPAVLKTMKPYLDSLAGNPSSFHFFGRKSEKAIENARQKVAKFLNCSPEEIVFTGSATEANNLAIFGIVKPFKFVSVKPHIITSLIEHSSVFEPCRVLEDEGAELTYLPSTKKGFIRVSELKKALSPVRNRRFSNGVKKNTVLVSIIYANNEVGTIQPIVEMARAIRRFKKSEKYPLFHIDAVQAVNYLDCDVKKLGVDLLSLSGQKIYGPKGVGALYIKKGTPITPLIHGGGQEGGLRSGTENVAFIIGLGEAIFQIKKNRQKSAKIRNLKNKLHGGIIKNISDIKLNGSLENSLPNILNITFRGVEGEAIGLALDSKGIAVSTGSACAAYDLKPSRVLLAMGLSHEQAHGAIRFSLGKYTTEKEIDKVLKVLPGIIKRLRKISGYNSK